MQTDSQHAPVATSWSPPLATGPSGHWECECGKTLRYAYRRAGQKGHCPACGRSFIIPRLPPVAGAEWTLRGHHGPIQAVAFSPDGRLLATSAEATSPPAAKSELAETLLWDTSTGLVAAMLRWHRQSVGALAFSPDGRLLATGGKDQAVSLWNMERGLWDTVMGVQERVLRDYSAPVTAIAFSPDGRLLASAANDGTIGICQTSDWRQAATIQTHRRGEGRLAFSPCGRYLAAVWRSRGSVIIWNALTGEQHLELRLFSDDDADDLGVGFSADGARLLVLGGDQVRIWELSTCQVLASIEAPGSEALAVAPQGDLIATGGRDPETGASARLWDTSTLIGVRDFEGHTQNVSSIAFSPDGKLLVSGGRDGIANLWLLG